MDVTFSDEAAPEALGSGIQQLGRSAMIALKGKQYENDRSDETGLG
jgi:hypothetical protein